MSFAIAAYAITGLTLAVYLVLLHRECARLESDSR
jgi:hypothetical protein